MRANMLCLGCLTLLSVSVLQAQDGNGIWSKAYSAASARSAANAHGYADVGFGPAIMGIPHKPFTAKRTYSDQATKNGVNVGEPITAEWTVARDDHGRIHYEMAYEGTRREKMVIEGFDIQIYDPVAHTCVRYFANADHSLPADPTVTVHRQARMSELSQPRPPELEKDAKKEAPSSDPAPSPREELQQENKKPADPPITFLHLKDNLPIQSIEGIKVVGHNVVLKYGPKNQYFQIQQNWFSPEFALDMRQILLRETMGTETVETKDLVEGEPNPALFQIPPGYIVPKEK